ncbi:ribonuclease P protein subunit [Candidatus Woesearchaeota archaeon]|nr:ribonuclease P protein subunit [Candidatus Woesearchaeota archaeon]
MKAEKEIELLGLKAIVKDAKNHSLIGLKGVIVEETKNMLIIQGELGKKKVIKDQVLLEIEVKGKKIEVIGKDLVGKSEERIK